MNSLANIDENARQVRLKQTLVALPSGTRLLDAGAGELKNRQYYGHLTYISQNFCEYKGAGGRLDEGPHPDSWYTSRIDLVSDITAIAGSDASFDAILCSEVLEHVPVPTHALYEFARLLKIGGVIILTAPFASNVHMAPYHFCSGFSKYWYEHNLARRGLLIKELTAVGDWYGLLRQEIMRLGGLERNKGNWAWPPAYAYALFGTLHFRIRSSQRAEDLTCFGWQYAAVKVTSNVHDSH